LITNNLKEIKDMDKTLLKILNRSAQVSNWLCLYNTIQAAADIHASITMMNVDDRIPILSDLLPLFTTEIDELNVGIAETIDFDRSLKSQRITIKKGVNEHLDILKLEYSKLDDKLTNFLFQDTRNGLIPNMSNYFSELKYIFFPQVGYLLCATKNERNFASPIAFETLQFQDLAYQFASDDQKCYFYTNQRTQFLDSNIGDYQGKMIDAAWKTDNIQEFL
jgi:DNA mismatch repair ATPase MutS